MSAFAHRSRWFIGTWSVVIAVMVVPVLLPGTEPVVFGANAWFVALIASSAALCVLSSTWLLYIAHRRDLSEVGFVAVWFLVLSVMSLVHGLSVPGVLYGSNNAFSGSVLVAGPLAVVAVSPALFRDRRWANWMASHWRVWALVWSAGVASLAVVLLIDPNILDTPSVGSRLALTSAVPTVGLAMLYSWRHLTMAAVSGSSRYMAVFVGFVFTGVGNLVWVTSVGFGPTFWFAHFFEIVGVFAGTVGGGIAYFRLGRRNDLIGPIIEADPLIALDLALDPSVGAFMSDLDSKDVVTRDHVLRTTEAAMQVAMSMKLRPIEVRDTGIGAVLHDIGKLEISDSVLNKPGRLTDQEFEIMKTHTVIGYELITANPALGSVAHVVRGHHERVDGMGYPDGLVGDQNSMPARIVAVCDAFDAMAHDRPYRSGMGRSKAVSILREHAGSQWDRAAVEALVALVAADRIRTSPTTLDHLGRDLDERAAPTETEQGDNACGCLAALPEGIAEQIHSHLAV